MSSLEMSLDDSSVTLTIRLIMQGKEVGCIIGKKGEIVKKFREESGARINISDGSCPERIVTITGGTNAIFKAFALICKKFEEDLQNAPNAGNVPKPPITLRLVVPGSQCGSLIGKGGSKIKEIREVTGASMQIASEMLPNSTERAVTISGTSEAITQCIYHICCVMLESPPKGTTIPYRPKPQVSGPIIVAGGQTYTIQGNYAVPAHPDLSKLAGNSPASLAALGLGGLGSHNGGGLNPAALAAIAGSQLRNNSQNRQPGAPTQTLEMNVSNDLIGCIIGKGGSKIAEIRQISGAMIRISNCEDREDGNTDRTITITGNPDAVSLAQYVINMSLDLQKANLEAQKNAGGGSSSGPSGGSGGNSGGSGGGDNSSSSVSSAIPLAQLLTKPGAINSLSSLNALGGLSDLLSGGGDEHVQTTGVHRRAYVPKMRTVGGSSSSSSTTSAANGSSRVRSDRNKFMPY